MHPFVAGFDLADGIHHIHAIGYFAEYGITEALRSWCCVIKETVLTNIDEELAGGTVDDIGACHGDRTMIILKPVCGFILDGRLLVALVAHVGSQATALNHKAVDDPVKDGVFVEAVIGVSDKVSGADWCIDGIEFEDNVAHAGFDANGWIGCLGHYFSPCFGLNMAGIARADKRGNRQWTWTG